MPLGRKTMNNWLQHRFDRLSDRIEHIFSTWWGVTLYVGAACAVYAIWQWDGLDRFFYISGGMLVVLLLGASRRDSIANQVKMDAMTTDNDLDGIEERTEQDIQDIRAAHPNIDDSAHKSR